MADRVPSVSEIIKQLPPSFRGRFESLGQYVKSILGEIRGSDAPPLSINRLRFIQLIVFIYVLTRYLEEGTRAAEHAVDVSLEFGFESFSVGKTVFSKDNENTLLGRTLANRLIASIEEPSIINALGNSSNTRSLIISLLARTRYLDGKRLDRRR